MIIRAVHNKENPYCLVRRSTAQDQNLPARALGVLIYLMSKPDDWEPTIADICQRFPDIGKNQTYRIINEIFIPLGYARRVPERKNGKIRRWVTEIYEEPVSGFGEVENSQNQTKLLPQNREVAQSPENQTEIPENAIIHPQNRENSQSEPVPGFGELVSINRQNTDIQNTEQQQAAEIREREIAAAADPFDDPHKSIFSFYTVEDFVKATKPHITNPGGLARILWRSGAEDSAIGQWVLAKKERRELEERLRDSQEAGDFDWDEHADSLIARNDLSQLQNELEGIEERGGPAHDWERRIVAYLKEHAADAA